MADRVEGLEVVIPYSYLKHPGHLVHEGQTSLRANSFILASS
jgi:hypothetical protein